MSFVEQTIVLTYYNVGDILQELGGLISMFQTALGSLGGIFIILFFRKLSGHIMTIYKFKQY